MDKKQQQILTYTFALQFDDEQLKEEFRVGRITQEQYLEITDLKRDKSIKEIEQLLESAKEDIKFEEQKIKQQEQEKRKKREAQVEKISSSAELAKKNFKNNKKKFTKIIVSILLVVVGMVVVIGGAKYVYSNYIGFTDVDLGSMIIIEYDQDEYTANPTFTWNGIYYNDSGYYDDYKEGLRETGIYTDDQIEALIPNYNADVYSSIQQIYNGYDLSTENELVNGDKIEISINYNSDLAKQHKINVVNNKAEFEIEGLRQQVTSDEITKETLDSLGGIEELEAEAVEEPYRSDGTDYSTTVKAVKFLFEDAENNPLDSTVSNDDYYYMGTDYDQYLNIAYFITDEFKDNDGKLDSSLDENYLCNQQFNVYKQNDQVVINADEDFTDCINVNNSDNIDEAIDNRGRSIGLDDEYVVLEGML